MISIMNNGKGIPVVHHKDENMFVPTMIFGHLLTSSNFNDEEEKVGFHPRLREDAHFFLVVEPLRG